MARPKYRAVRCEADGHKFDSKMERDFYTYLGFVDLGGCGLDGILGFDVHPTVSLPGGVRWKLDFQVYTVRGRSFFVDVKGAITQSFTVKRKLFDNCHPNAPLLVVKRIGKAWKVVEADNRTLTRLDLSEWPRD